MIILILAWGVLFLFTLAAGTVVIHFLSRLLQTSGRETPETAVWCGLVFLSATALGLSPAGPLTAIRVLPVFGIILALSCLLPDIRRTIWKTIACYRGLRPGRVASLLAVVISSMYFSQAPCQYDTLLYHHQAAKWFAQYGAVKGLALIHYRFGFVSSWFALTAPFENLLPGRSAAILNGFVFISALMELLSGFQRIFSRSGTSEDIFKVTGLAAVLGFHVLFLDPVSASPDFPINVMTVVILSRLFKAAAHHRRTVSAGVLVMAVLMPLVKLSAVPVTAGIILLYVLEDRSRIEKFKRLAAAVFLQSVALAPLCLVSWIISGAFIFPVGFLSPDVPWRIDPQMMRAVSASIRNWARWNGPVPPGAAQWGWIIPWLLSYKGMLFFILGIANLVAAGLALIPGRNRRNVFLSPAVPLIGLAGTIYLFFTAPNPRFGLGVLIAGGCWLLASGAIPSKSITEPSLHKQSRIINTVAAASILGIFALIIHPVDSWRSAYYRYAESSFFSASSGRLNWLAPSEIPHIGYQRRPGGGALDAFRLVLQESRMDGFDYYHPVNSDICGPAPLPASPGVLENIRLAHPEQGLSGGFIPER